MPAISRRSFVHTAALLPAVAAGLSLRKPRIQDSRAIGKTLHSKFAVNIEMWFGRMSVEDKIRKTAELGFSAVEFWPWRGKNLDAIKAVCAETGVTITQFTGWGFSPGLNDPKNHEKFTAEIEAGCATAQKLGVKKMCVVGGQDVDGMTQKEMHDAIVKGLRLAAPIAEKADVMLVLEPMNIRVDHKGHCLYGSAAPIDIVQRVGSSHVKILWDLYHMAISEGDICRHLREGFKETGDYQLADNPGRLEPGTGEIAYWRVLKEIHELGYRDYIGLECSPEGGDWLRAAQRVAAADKW